MRGGEEEEKEEVKERVDSRLRVLFLAKKKEVENNFCIKKKALGKMADLKFVRAHKRL